jgi:hypothetical protein
MKNVYLLSGIIVLNYIAGLNAMEEYLALESLLRFCSTNWTAIFTLLDEKPDVLDVNRYRFGAFGNTLLYHAVHTENLLAAERLLKKYKADTNILGRTKGIGEKVTPLMEASGRGNIPMMKLLLAYGADPFIKTSGEGWDSFFYAACAAKDYYNPEIEKILAQNCCICCDIKKTMISLPCAKRICAECHYELLTKTECPSCRKEFEK